MKSLLNKGSTTDFQVRQWGIRRTWKYVVPLKQQAVTRRVTVAYPTENAFFRGEAVNLFCLTHRTARAVPLPHDSGRARALR